MRKGNPWNVTNFILYTFLFSLLGFLCFVIGCNNSDKHGPYHSTKFYYPNYHPALLDIEEHLDRREYKNVESTIQKIDSISFKSTDRLYLNLQKSFILIRNKNYDKALNTLAQTRFTNGTDSILLSMYYRIHSYLYTRKNLPDKALLYADSSLLHSQDDISRIKAINNTANIHLFYKSNYSLSDSLYSNSLRIANASKLTVSHSLRATMDYFLAVSSRYLTNYDKSLVHIDKAIRHFRMSSNDYMLSYAYSEYANILQNISQQDGRLLSLYDSAYSLALRLKDTQNILLSLTNKGVAYSSHYSKYQLASKSFNQALSYCRSKNDSCYVITRLTQNQIRLDPLTASNTSICSESANPYENANTNYIKAEYYFKQTKYQLSEYYSNLAVFELQAIFSKSESSSNTYFSSLKLYQSINAESNMELYFKTRQDKYLRQALHVYNEIDRTFCEQYSKSNQSQQTLMHNLDLQSQIYSSILYYIIKLTQFHSINLDHLILRLFKRTHLNYLSESIEPIFNNISPIKPIEFLKSANIGQINKNEFESLVKWCRKNNSIIILNSTHKSEHLYAILNKDSLHTISVFSTKHFGINSLNHRSYESCIEKLSSLYKNEYIILTGNDKKSLHYQFKDGLDQNNTKFIFAHNLSRIVLTNLDYIITENKPTLFSYANEELHELPNTWRETKTIENIYSGEVNIHAGHYSNSTVLKKSLEQPGIVHVTGHGYIPLHNNQYSYIILNNKGETFQQYEFDDIESKCDLLVLNICEAGKGLRSPSQDVISLASAAQASGVKIVIGSDMNITDVQARIFANNFYKELQISNNPIMAFFNTKNNPNQAHDIGEGFFISI